MSDDLKKTLPKVRTFARDIESARLKSGEALPADVTVPVMKTDAPKKSDPLPDVATPSTHIPAFHELSKKSALETIKPIHFAHKEPVVLKGPDIVTTPQASPTPSHKKIQVRTKKRPLTPSKITGGGTIITDTKKAEFNFLTSFVASIERSFKSFAKAFEQKKRPIYTITATERRKGVIQKATSKTGTIFTADNETLKEEIRRRQQRDTHKVDPNDGTTEVIWSPNTEPGYALLEEAPKVSPRNVTLEFKKRSLPQIPQAPEPVVVIPEPPAPISLERVVEVLPPTLPMLIPEPVIIVPEPTPMFEAAIPPVVAEPEPTPAVPDVYREETYTEPAPTPDTPVESPLLKWTAIRNLNDVTKVRTNTLAIGIIGIVFTLIVVVVGIRTMLDFLTPTEEEIMLVADADPLTAVSSVSDLIIEELTPGAFLTSLQSYEGVAPVELRILNAKEEVVAARDILSLMTLRVDSTFSQSVSEVRIVHLEASRALVLKVTDPITTLGSLLKWEPTMVADLSDVLGLMVLSSDKKFVDQTYRSIDVRILRDEDLPMLVYGFIDENTVVIAEDIEDFAVLLGKSE